MKKTSKFPTIFIFTLFTLSFIASTPLNLTRNTLGRFTEPVPSTENTFTYYLEEINENYTLIFDAIVINSRGEIDIILEDHSNNHGLNYIFLNGTVHEESTNILDLSPGSHSLTRTHNFTRTYTYLVAMKFFDRVNGDNVVISKNITSLNMTNGTISDFVETPPDFFTVHSGNLTNYGESNATVNTIFLYHLNETTGPVIDSSLYNNSGVAENGVTRGATGRFATTCFDFDGIDDYVDINSTYNFTGELYVDFWIRYDAIPTDNNDFYQYYIGKENTIAAGMYFDKQGPQFDYYLNFKLYDNSDTLYELDAEMPADPIPNRWYHVAFAYNESHQYIILDGVELDSSSIGNITHKLQDSNWTIGQWEASDYHDGKIEEVQLFNTTNVDIASLFPIRYLDNDTIDMQAENGEISVTAFFTNSTEVEFFDIQANYTYNDTIVNLTQEKIEVYNFTGSNWFEMQNFSTLFNSTDFINDANSTSLIKVNYTGNITDFNMSFDQFILRNYYPSNTSDLGWSHESDDNRVVLFQNTTTNTTGFVVDFVINNPLEDIFESITYYEFTITEGTINGSIDFQVYMYNYTAGEYFLANSLVDVTELDTTNELFFKIDSIPLTFFDDIIESNNETQKISFLFNFSSETVKIFLDYINKQIYYMNTSDYVDYSNDIGLEFFRTTDDDDDGGGDGGEVDDTEIVNPFAIIANEQFVFIIVVLILVGSISIYAYNTLMKGGKRKGRKR